MFKIISAFTDLSDCAVMFVRMLLLHQVPVDWFNNVLQCMKQIKPCNLVTIAATTYQTLGISDAKLLLSPSCKQCLGEWQRISVIVIEKQSTQVIRSARFDLINFIFSSAG